jgi:hypothetical protein
MELNPVLQSLELNFVLNNLNFACIGYHISLLLYSVRNSVVMITLVSYAYACLGAPTYSEQMHFLVDL